MNFETLRDQNQEIKDLIRSVLNLERIFEDQENRVLFLEDQTKINQKDIKLLNETVEIRNTRIQDLENTVKEEKNKMLILQVHLTKKNIERIKQINKHVSK